MAAKDEEVLESENCVFEWDENSQLYFHASSGFYHDPNAGWYYNTRDGSYYKFEDGGYVPLLESHMGGDANQDQDQDQDHHQDQQHSGTVSQTSPCQGAIIDSHHEVPPSTCHEGIGDDDPENPPPPSEWLEETLIDLYLSGYSNSSTNAVDKGDIPIETDVGCHTTFMHHGAEDNCTLEIEEGEWIEEDLQDATEPSERHSGEGVSWYEENWRAQYGQVVQSSEENAPSPIIDLWDWSVITETIVKKKNGKKKKYRIDRLIGKLVKPSAKLHPSMPSGGRVLKTTAICEVNFALVRVSSGQVYRLKSPSLKYLSSLSAYDSSNPTKDWGFPDLSIDKQDHNPPKFSESSDKDIVAVTPAASPALPNQSMSKGLAYRDRAAERRALHGVFGVGPGQKNSGRDCELDVSLVSKSTEEAATEALHMSFGAGSYARRVLENLGWKEGEALGKTSKGLLQPLEAVGNKGFAGLGWNQSRPDYR